MPTFYFNLKQGTHTTVDREGTELADAAAARAHAAVIAREIMRNDGYRMLTCRLLVQDADRNPCFELLFAMVAERLELLSSETRNAIQMRAGTLTRLHDDIQAVHRSLLQLRATLASVDGRPHLAAVDGKRVDP